MCPVLARGNRFATCRNSDHRIRCPDRLHHFVGQCATVDSLAVDHLASECNEQRKDVVFNPFVALVVSVSYEDPHEGVRFVLLYLACAHLGSVSILIIRVDKSFSLNHRYRW